MFFVCGRVSNVFFCFSQKAIYNLHLHVQNMQYYIAGFMVGTLFIYVCKKHRKRERESERERDARLE